MGADVVLAATPIRPEAYRLYGEILSADREDIAPCAANQGTAVRRNHQIAIHALRPTARANFASFRCAPRTEWPMPLLVLEKHPHSTQAFVPMNASRYVVVVAIGRDEPDLETLRAFVVEGGAAISYGPEVWHHPMIALDRVTDFACLVWEDGTAADAVECVIARHRLFLAQPEPHLADVVLLRPTPTAPGARRE